MSDLGREARSRTGLSVGAVTVLRAARDGRLLRDESGWYVAGRTQSLARMDVRAALVAEVGGLVEHEAPYRLTEAGAEALGTES